MIPIRSQLLRAGGEPTVAARVRKIAAKKTKTTLMRTAAVVRGINVTWLGC